MKMFGLAAIAAVAAMAFIGASSASAEHTALCKEAAALCPEDKLVKSIHMTAGTTVLKTSILTVLCLSSLAEGHITSPNYLGAPLVGTLLPIVWSNCGSNAAHDNCSVTTLAGGTISALKTAAGLGTATSENAKVLVLCSGFLHCVYGGPSVGPFNVEGAGHTAGAGKGMFTATELKVPNISGFLCPSESKWTALYEPLENTYASS